MKFTITMKTPDCCSRAIEQLQNQDIDTYEIEKMLKRWFDWGECVTLEIDTEKETCVVLE